jgi:hypothetical protein
MTAMITRPQDQPSYLVRAFLKNLLFQILIILIVIQISLVASWGWTWLLFWSHQFSSVFIRIATVIGSALVAGLISRALLNNHSRFLRWICSLNSVIFSLVGMSFLSQNQVGFKLTLGSNLSSINWNGLWQLSLGSLITSAVIYAWSSPRKTEVVVEPRSDETVIETDSVFETNLIKPHEQTGHPIQEAVSPSPTARSREMPGSRKKRSKKQSAFQRRSIGYFRALQKNMTHLFNKVQRFRIIDAITSWTSSIQTPVKPKRTRQPKLNPSRRTAMKLGQPIRLIGLEEHRCPFCLELVEESDPAGVVICPICHAYHHKSCWDITGTCQVPHIHS